METQNSRAPETMKQERSQERKEPADGAEGRQSNNAPLYGKRRIIIPAAILVLAALVGAWYWYVNLRDYVSTDDAYIDQNRVAVSSKILGRIASLAVDEGDSVSGGQAIVQLDEKDLNAQKDQALASLRLAEESLRLSQVQLERSQEDYARAENQFENAVITKEDYDHSRNAVEAARAEHSIALARIGAAQAQVAVVQAELDNCTIYSPVTGSVAKRWVLPGEIVQPGQPVFAIYDRTQTWVTANLEETNLQDLRLGQEVQISVDTYPDKSFAGRVFQIGGSTAAQFSLIPPTNASGNFTKVTQRVPIKISIRQHLATHESPVLLLPGMSVEVRIKVK